MNRVSAGVSGDKSAGTEIRTRLQGARRHWVAVALVCAVALSGCGGEVGAASFSLLCDALGLPPRV
jgi:hypothetical protein